MISRDKIAGAVYGLALGDALGRPTEFMKLKAIHKAYGKTNYMPLPQPALFTDDTQMSIAVSRALQSARHFGPKELVRTLTNEFMRWKTYDAPRAPGVTCLRAISRLHITREKHQSWIFASMVDSKGCGANMRVLPAAFIPNHDVMVGTSQLQAALTHGHPVALAATELTAWAIRWAAEGADVMNLPTMLRARAMTQHGVYRRDYLGALDHRWPNLGEVDMSWAWRVLRDQLVRVNDALHRGRINDVCAVLGQAWIAEEALATALYFAAQYADDPVMAISAAARTSGDSDSIACITGAIIGAAAGEYAWPKAWRERIERRHDLEQMIDFLWSQYQ